jgi:hypothetical protein
MLDRLWSTDQLSEEQAIQLALKAQHSARARRRRT